jgi:hypothetical protein
MTCKGKGARKFAPVTEDYTLAIPEGDLWFSAPTSNSVVQLSSHCMSYDFTAQDGRKNIGGWIETAAGLAGR